MQKHERMIVDAVQEIVTPGVVHFKPKSSRGHPAVVVTMPDGMQFKKSIPCSPKNYDDAILYSQSWARRILRDLRANKG